RVGGERRDELFLRFEVVINRRLAHVSQRSHRADGEILDALGNQETACRIHDPLAALRVTARFASLPGLAAGRFRGQIRSAARLELRAGARGSGSVRRSFRSRGHGYTGCEAESNPALVYQASSFCPRSKLQGGEAA